MFKAAENLVALSAPVNIALTGLRYSASGVSYDEIDPRRRDA